MVPSSSMKPPLSFIGSLSVDLDSIFVLQGALGSIGGSFQPGKPSLVSEVGTSSHPLSFEAYALGWVMGTNSLLSEEIVA